MNAIADKEYSTLTLIAKRTLQEGTPLLEVACKIRLWRTGLPKPLLNKLLEGLVIDQSKNKQDQDEMQHDDPDGNRPVERSPDHHEAFLMR